MQDLPESEVDLRPNEPTYLVLESPSLKLKLKLKRLTTSWLAFFGTKTDDYNQTTKFIRQFFFKSFNTCLKKKDFFWVFCFLFFMVFFSYNCTYLLIPPWPRSLCCCLHPLQRVDHLVLDQSHLVLGEFIKTTLLLHS